MPLPIVLVESSYLSYTLEDDDEVHVVVKYAPTNCFRRVPPGGPGG